jgi:hypothetical protein
MESQAALQRIIDRDRSPTLAFQCITSKSCRPEIALAVRKDDREGRGAMEALIVGFVSIAVIWLVVIYGSLYMNKNVQ